MNSLWFVLGVCFGVCGYINSLNCRHCCWFNFVNSVLWLLSVVSILLSLGTGLKDGRNLLLYRKKINLLFLYMPCFPENGPGEHFLHKMPIPDSTWLPKNQKQDRLTNDFCWLPWKICPLDECLALQIWLFCPLTSWLQSWSCLRWEHPAKDKKRFQIKHKKPQDWASFWRD